MGKERNSDVHGILKLVLGGERIRGAKESLLARGTKDWPDVAI